MFLLMVPSERQKGALTRLILEHRLWGERPFVLIDVGCSGGIQGWEILGDRLSAVGFDPLIAEIDRLNTENRQPGTRYEAAFITCASYDQLFAPGLREDRIRSKNNDPFSRSSTAAAMARMPTSYVQEVFNAGAPVALTNRRLELDEYVSDPNERAHVDFVKVDTDGHDIEVLLGARGIFASGGVLGLNVEVQFHGAVHDFANTFSNIDRLLRGYGFTLFELQPYRYSRKALPAPFVYDLAAQTTSGQMLWGEALYFRDLAAPEYEQMWAVDITPERVMKLACLFDIFDLPDCAAELIQSRGTFLAPDTRQYMLDALASGTPGSYASLVHSFEEDYKHFYPSQLQPPVLSSPPPATPAPSDELSEHPALAHAISEIAGLSDHLAQVKRRNAKLRARVESQERRLAFLTQRVQDLKTERHEKNR